MTIDNILWIFLNIYVKNIIRRQSFKVVTNVYNHVYLFGKA